MIRNIKILFGLIFPIIFITISENDITAQAYKIKLDIKGAEHLKAQLGYYQGENQYVIQSESFDKNGKLVFEGKDALPPGIYLVVVEKIGFFDFFIKNETEFSFKSDTSALIQSMIVKESIENRLFYQYQKKLINLKYKLAEIDSMIVKKSIPEDSLQIFKNKKLEIEHKSYALIDSIKQNNPASFLTKILTAMEMNNPDSINYTDPDYLRTPFYDKLIRLFIKKNINNNTQTIISETTKLLNSIPYTLPNYQYILNYLLNFYNNYYKNGINEVFVFLADNYFLPDKANWINKQALIKLKERRDFLAQGLPGMPASDLTLESATGEYFSVLQVEAKMTLLYFWSADCGHCTKSTQILKNNYEALSKKGIEIFAVNVDKEKDKWLRKLEENELPWINCYDPKETSHYRDKYYVYGSPLLIIIGQNKKILAVKNGEIEIENFVNQLTK